MGLRIAATLLLLPATLLAEEWVSDSDGSLAFEAGFEGDPLPGEFPEFTVNFTGEALTVTVNLMVSDMGDDEMNAILHDSAWFAVDKFAEARYTATDVRCDSDGSCLAQGELTLKGVSRELAVPFSFRADGDNATIEGGLELDRTDFNVGSGMWATGESIDLEVELRFDITLARNE